MNLKSIADTAEYIKNLETTIKKQGILLDEYLKRIGELETENMKLRGENKGV